MFKILTLQQSENTKIVDFTNEEILYIFEVKGAVMQYRLK